MLLPVLMAGCANNPSDGPMESGSFFVPLPVVAADAVAGTRAVVDNSTYFPLLEYGIWVEALDAAETVDAANTLWYHTMCGYDNIKAERKGVAAPDNIWNFTPYGGPASSTRIGLFPNRGAKVNVYGVYPYMPDFDPADANRIPFEVGLTDDTNYDYMYTGPVLLSVPASGSINENLPFKHVMTLLEFRLSTTLVGTLTVNSISLEATGIADGQPRNIFLTKGTFSALDGSVDPGPAPAMSDKLTIGYNKNVAYKQSEEQKYTSFGVIVPEIGPSLTTGTRLKISFEFDYKNLNEDDDGILAGQGGEIILDLDDILTGGSAKGLLTGYMYSYTIEVDNFIKYNGYPEVQPWLPDDNIHDIIL